MSAETWTSTMTYRSRHGHVAIIARDVQGHELDSFVGGMLLRDHIVTTRVHLLWADGTELRIDPALPNEDPIAALVGGTVTPKPHEP